MSSEKQPSWCLGSGSIFSVGALSPQGHILLCLYFSVPGKEDQASIQSLDQYPGCKNIERGALRGRKIFGSRPSCSPSPLIPKVTRADRNTFPSSGEGREKQELTGPQLHCQSRFEPISLLTPVLLLLLPLGSSEIRPLPPFPLTPPISHS